MFIVLVFAFSINNVVACKMMEKEVVKTSGISMAEAKAEVVGTVRTMTAVSLTVADRAGDTGCFNGNFGCETVQAVSFEIHRIARYDLTETDMPGVRARTSERTEMGSISRISS